MTASTGSASSFTEQERITFMTDNHLLSILNDGPKSLEASVEELLRRGIAPGTDFIKDRLAYLSGLDQVRYDSVSEVYSRVRNHNTK